jgi:hypothetical protein
MTECRRSESEKQRELDAARNVIAVFETTHTGFGRPISRVRVVNGTGSPLLPVQLEID